MKRSILILSLVLITYLQAVSQSRTYPYTIDYYPFVKYEYNKIDFPGDSSKFNLVLKKIEDLIVKGDGKLNILQIGGSHIQADIYSNVTRQRLQNFYPGLNGGRGFVFPYSIAKTNNPVNLKVKSKGNWLGHRNIQKKYNSELLGLAGISITTSDTEASFKIYASKNYQKYDFNSVKLFYNMDSLNYKVQLANQQIIDSIYVDSARQYTEYFLSKYIDTLKVKVSRIDSLGKAFTFYGANLQTDDPGVVYHSIGINGASIPSFLRCQLFKEQLKVINPNLVILSLGTNDAYGKNFDPDVYYKNYEQLIQDINSANPNASIIITVPNDDYLYKKYPNKFTAEQETVIYKLAKKYNIGVWDLYKIMGGFNSSQTWFDYKLMRYDRIHFTRKGYIFKGNLFFNALLRMYDNYIENKLKTSFLNIKDN